ncbi:hypothetical protein EON83_22035 [bacterium]|nr:MAG: hypothetical protein EON83_22035 [bacterium]
MSAPANASVSDYSQWQPEEYLTEYYGEVQPDEHFAVEFLVETVARLKPVSVALEFGCGPTIHHALALANLVGELHMADYLESNRAEVEKWRRKDEGAFNWDHFGVETLQLEGNAHPTQEQVAEREELLREKITQVVPCDAFSSEPLGEGNNRIYPLVASHYCAEACTTDQEEWRACMRNISSLVETGGTLIISVCGAASAYAVGDRYFPCAGVDEKDVLACLLEIGFTDIDLRVRQVPSQSEQGFSSVVFASAVKGRQ